MQEREIFVIASSILGCRRNAGRRTGAGSLCADPAARADPDTIKTRSTSSPGQRVDVLVDCANLGTWAFHCHILTHAEGPNGMFGMVSALVVS